MRGLAQWFARAMSARRRDESGTTLIEVVTAAVIMGVVIAPIAMAVQQSLTFIPDAEQRTQAAIYRSIFIDSFADDVASASSVTADGDATCSAGTATTFATIDRDWSNKEITYRAEVGNDLVGRDADLHEVTMVRSIRVVPGGSPETLSMLTGYCEAGSTIAVPTHYADKDADPTMGQHEQLLVRVSLRDSMADQGLAEFTLGSVLHRSGFNS